MTELERRLLGEERARNHRARAAMAIVRAARELRPYEDLPEIQEAICSLYRTLRAVRPERRDEQEAEVITLKGKRT